MYLYIVLIGAVLYFTLWKDSEKKWRWVGLYFLFFVLAIPSATILGTSQVVLYPQERVLNSSQELRGVYKVGWEFSRLLPFESSAKPIAVDASGNRVEISGYDMSATPFHIPYPFYRTYYIYIFGFFYALVAYFAFREKAPAKAKDKNTKKGFFAGLAQSIKNLFGWFGSLRPPSRAEVIQQLDAIKTKETVSGYDSFLRQHKRSLFKHKDLMEEALKLRQEAVQRYIDFYQEIYAAKKREPLYLSAKEFQSKMKDTEARTYLLTEAFDIQLKVIESIIFSLKKMLSDPKGLRKLYFNIEYKNKVFWTSGINTYFSKVEAVYPEQEALEATSLRGALKKGREYIIKSGFSKNKKCKISELLDGEEFSELNRKGSSYLYTNEFLMSCANKDFSGIVVDQRSTRKNKDIGWLRRNVATFEFFLDRKILKTQEKVSGKVNSSFEKIFACSFDHFFLGENRLFESLKKNKESDLTIKVQPGVNMVLGNVRYTHYENKKKKEKGEGNNKHLLTSVLKFSATLGDCKYNPKYLHGLGDINDTSSDVATCVKSYSSNLLFLPRLLFSPKTQMPKELAAAINSIDLSSKPNFLSKLLKDQIQNQIEDYIQDQVTEFAGPLLQKFLLPYAAAAAAYADALIDEAMMSSMLSGIEITEAFAAAASSGLMDGVGGIDFG